MKTALDKQLLVEGLRQYPTWGDAWIAERRRVEELSRLLLSIEGSLLAYWTDIPEAELDGLRLKIRTTLGGFEPEAMWAEHLPENE